MCAIFAIFLVVLSSALAHQRFTIYDRIMQERDFSGYRAMIKGNNNVMLNLQYSGVTVFVPDNDAVDRYDGFFENGLVLYHMGPEVYTLKDMRLNYSFRSIHADNPPLWVSVVDNNYYINNAKVIETKSNYIAKCKKNLNLQQALHVVDRVLDPMLDTPFANPTAFDLLENAHHWKLGGRKVSNFFKRVQFNNKEGLFKKPGGHTFFIPIDDTKHDHRLQNIDNYIIDGHVTPHMVLFTRPARKNFAYETAANGDYVYIVLSMPNHDEKDYVKSHTILGNGQHRKGEILAEIVKGNIPVENGVVHLISQPLAVFDRELRPFPYLSVWYKISSDPFLNITYAIGQTGRVNQIIKREREIYTYFAPRDKSWKNYTGYGKEELGDILGRHLIVSDTRYTMSKLATILNNNGTTLETLGGTIRINVVYTKGSYFLVWGQNWIKVHRPDYECSDGVIHVIDGVFASPKPGVASTPSDTKNFWATLKYMVI